MTADFQQDDLLLREHYGQCQAVAAGEGDRLEAFHLAPRVTDTPIG